MSTSESDGSALTQRASFPAPPSIVTSCTSAPGSSSDVPATWTSTFVPLMLTTSVSSPSVPWIVARLLVVSRFAWKLFTCDGIATVYPYASRNVDMSRSLIRWRSPLS